MNGKEQKTVQLGCANGERTYRLPGINGQPIKGGHKPIIAKKPVPMDGPLVTTTCTPERAFFPDMPTTAAGMGSYLERTQGVRLNDLNDLSKTVGEMLQSDYILPASGPRSTGSWPPRPGSPSIATCATSAGVRASAWSGASMAARR
jgi:hypothetical protein